MSLIDTTSELYTHPDIRNQTQDKYFEHLERIRSRRLIAALEHKAAVDKKIEAQWTKDAEKWRKLEDQVQRELYLLDERIDKLENKIGILVTLNHNMRLAEGDPEA